MRSVFGWSLPPGCSYSDIDPDEGPCEICGMSLDNCICPECPVCESIGDPKCYIEHGLRRTEEQKFSKVCSDRMFEEDAFWMNIREQKLYEDWKLDQERK